MLTNEGKRPSLLVEIFLVPFEYGIDEQFSVTGKLNERPTVDRR